MLRITRRTLTFGSCLLLSLAVAGGGSASGQVAASAAIGDVDVTLALDQIAIVAGQPMTGRSVADAQGEIATHGLEGRVLGGAWEKWFEWSGATESAFALPGPARAGIYEVRAYAARDHEEASYSDRVLLTVTEIAPTIVTQPAGAIVAIGSNVTLAVTVAGTNPSFQWRRSDIAVPGATAATLTFSPAAVAHSGSYSVTVSNSAGIATSRPAALVVNPLSLPAVAVQVSRFPPTGGRQSVAVDAARVGDVVSLSSFSTVTTGAGWWHNVLVRRPAITNTVAIPPADGSGFTAAHEAWNKDGWGNPHVDGGGYNAAVIGRPATDLGNRAPFMHRLAGGQATSTRAVEFVLDAPGQWLVRGEVLDAAGQLVALSTASTVTVTNPPLATDPASMTYPYGRDDRFVGVFWNAGQAHRLWSTWRADFQTTYPATWAVNWKLMWQPSPYFSRVGGGWLRPNPLPESPWQPFWSAHQVYAIVPDEGGASKLTHDITSRAFAARAALRLMDVGVDFVAIDYTNQFVEPIEEVLPAMDNLAQAFAAAARQSQTGERIRLTAVVPANVNTGDWTRNGGFGPQAIARFNAKLTTLYNRYARFESGWFHLEDDRGVRKPLLLLWVGAGGEDDPDGKLSAAKLNQLRLVDGRRLSDVFTIRWVGAFLASNPRFLTGSSYTVPGAEGPVTGRHANPKFWSYHESHPPGATLMPGGAGIEAVTVQPLTAGRDRFGRTWRVNWPAGQGFHYETPATDEPVPLASYGRTWRNALATARALNPKFLLTTWVEFGSENDEPRPELSVTIMDNNKYGTHFGDAFKETVRWFKYREPAAWIDSFAVNDETRPFAQTPASVWPAFSAGQVVRLQGWVTPNIATTFAGGAVRVYVDDTLLGTATVGGAANGATAWSYDLAVSALAIGPQTLKVVADDGVGGSVLAGFQFQGEAPRSSLPIVVTR